MHVRSFSWGSNNISWSVIISELLHAAEQRGHRPVFLSTNGYKGTSYWDQDRGFQDDLYQREYLRSGQTFDLDLTYTVPQNFPERFLLGSKIKAAIYAYESSIMPEHWQKFYHLVDYVLPPSQYCAAMFARNGCPKEKIQVLPHGVDLDVFNPETVKPAKLQTEKKFKFLCLGEPHFRKQIDKLLRLYCETFTAKDDVTLVLKTKIFSTPEDYAERKTFEQDLKPVLTALRAKHGESMPEIIVVPGRLKNIASLYRFCDAFVLMTASEGWCVPYLEALAMGLTVIAPRHGGQLEYLNDENAILTTCGVRRARAEEQYWGGHPKATVGDPDEAAFAAAMKLVYQEKKPLAARKAAALATAKRFTWLAAWDQLEALCNRPAA